MIDLDRATAVLSPKQITSIAEAQKTPHIAVWDGAVSSGKTVASLLAFVIALAKAPSSGLIVIVGKSINTIEQNIITLLQDPLLFGFVADHVHHTKGSTSATILGRDVRLIGANDAKAEGRIRGSTIYLAYVDEATLLPQAFWMMLMSRGRMFGSKVFATTNPDGPGHWLMTDFIAKGLDVGLVRFRFTIADNPSLDPAHVARLKKQYVGLWYRRFILGEWCLAEGAIYDMFDPSRHVVDALPPIERWISLGVDYGTVNPFAAELIGLGKDRRLYVADEWWWDSKAQHRQLTDPQYSEKVRGWLADMPVPGTPLTGVRPEFYVVDPSAASFVTQLFQDGVTPTLGDNAVLDGIRTVSGLFARDRLRIHRRCVHLRRELPSYSWDPDQALKGIDAPLKIDDHAPDGLRYGTHTTRALWHNAVRLDLTEAA